MGEDTAATDSAAEDDSGNQKWREENTGFLLV